MTTSLYNINKYTRFNLSESLSDITVFIRNFSQRVHNQIKAEEGTQYRCKFKSYSDEFRYEVSEDWLDDNFERFFKDTDNEVLVSLDYLSDFGFIFSIVYTPDGEHIVTGHSTGMIQLRHGSTGVVLCTLRNIQFPPKPIYALEFSKTDDKVCYAACMDGNVYKIEIPKILGTADNPPVYCIRADPALESLKIQFYGGPGLSSYCTPFLTQRAEAQSLGVTADDTKIIVGYSDTSIKVYDVETQEVDLTYKVHKLRLPFIPKKLQRVHSGQVCAVRTHHDRPNVFASAGWDNTARVWDIRCAVGCVMTFEGVNVVSDSIDLNRNHLITGSWQPTEGLCLWDIVARKKLAVIRAQNRRHNVDGEYIYACRYWRSSDYNRKGKYAIIGGSGTSSVEIINLHNRYITCSYPCLGNVLAIASYGERIAFGGTATIFHIVRFHDPKHEKETYEPFNEPDYDYTCKAVRPYSDDSSLDDHGYVNVELLEHQELQQEQEITEQKINVVEKNELESSHQKKSDTVKIETKQSELETINKRKMNEEDSDNINNGVKPIDQKKIHEEESEQRQSAVESNDQKESNIENSEQRKSGVEASDPSKVDEENSAQEGREAEPSDQRKSIAKKSEYEISAVEKADDRNTVLEHGREQSVENKGGVEL